MIDSASSLRFQTATGIALPTTWRAANEGAAYRRQPLPAAAGHAPHFENVVFAGGGNRCFWQAGFWSVAAPILQLRPSRVAAVSAGSAMACALFSETFDQGFRRYKQALAANARNLYLKNVWHRKPVFPHGRIYREAIISSLGPQALSRLQRGPEISVLISAPPPWASPRMAWLLGVIATGIDALGKDQVHASAGRRIGFKPLCVPVRECSTPEALTDLILASSCAPPLIPQIHRNGVALLDGGLVDNVPILGLAGARGRTLVLLTRQFRHLPEVDGRTYVQPSHPIPAGAWDYTDHRAVQSTFDLGRRDGERFCAKALA